MRLKTNIAVSETGFLFDPNSGESFNLNKTGQFILRLLKENKEESEIIETVMSQYQVETDVLQKYLDDFIRMLRQYNLLEREEY